MKRDDSTLDLPLIPYSPSLHSSKMLAEDQSDTLGRGAVATTVVVAKGRNTCRSQKVILESLCDSILDKIVCIKCRWTNGNPSNRPTDSQLRKTLSCPSLMFLIPNLVRLWGYLLHNLRKYLRGWDSGDISGFEEPLKGALGKGTLWEQNEVRSVAL